MKIIILEGSADELPTLLGDVLTMMAPLHTDAPAARLSTPMRQCPIHGDTAIESETMPGTWWCRVRLPNGQRCTEMLQIAA